MPDTDRTAIYAEDGFIVRRTPDGRTEKLLSISDIRLPGKHNVENYMTAIALTDGYVSAQTIAEIAKSFGGVEHRLEFVRELDGVRYYNGSIDSSPTRTEAALRSFDRKVICMLGGYDKNIPYEPLAKPLIDCTKTIVLCGATAPKIKAALLSCPDYHGSPSIIEESDFEAAVNAARNAASDGDIVILSPASASFDLFVNFEARGKRFKEIVNAW